MNKLVNYVKASYEELKKVNWPTRKQAINLTIVVVIFSVALAVYTGIFDTIFRKLLEKIILKG